MDLGYRGFIVKDRTGDLGWRTVGIATLPELETVLLESASMGIQPEVLEHVLESIRGMNTTEDSTTTIPQTSTASTSATTTTPRPNTPTPVPVKGCKLPAFVPAPWNAAASRGSGKMHTKPGNAVDVLAATLRDGIRPQAKFNPNIKPMICYIALVIWPNVDFHYYRLDDNKKWSHKPGQTPAINTDKAGKLIADPKTAARGKYTVFVSYLETHTGDLWLFIMLDFSKLFSIGVEASTMFVRDMFSKAALHDGKPLVALETTIVTHGMPHPHNLSTALEVEDIVRQHGVIPATIGIIQGKVYHPDSWNIWLTQLLRPSKHPAGIWHMFFQSADLTELGRTPVTVVSAGVKSILDIERTLEYLETQGVCVSTYGESRDFPAFFSCHSGHQAPYNVTSPLQAASLIAAQESLGLQSGNLIAVPIPEQYDTLGQEIEGVIQGVVHEARNKNIQGKEVTPFILKRTVVGGSIVDFTARLGTQDVQSNGGTYPGTVKQSFGGVGRNLADGLSRLGVDTLFISAVGNDSHTATFESHCKHMNLSGVLRLEDQRTATYWAVLKSNGEVIFGIGDMDIHQQISPRYPADLSKAMKPFETDAFEAVVYTTPNLNELRTMAAHVSGKQPSSTVIDSADDMDLNAVIEETLSLLTPVSKHIPVTMYHSDITCLISNLLSAFLAGVLSGQDTPTCMTSGLLGARLSLQSSRAVPDTLTAQNVRVENPIKPSVFYL
ncbi:PSUG-like protein [Mya arenaria]|uniref:PSUG-like protein n=1 Tax=Mya arenaria TaxID=6604 RepID=A0ABY7F1Z5_MYAAR|nr:PSUG-like protein [Mya arenaria]